MSAEPSSTSAPAGANPGIHAGTKAHPKPQPRGWRWFLERYGALLALLLLIVGTAIVEAWKVPVEDRAFLKPQNFINILRQNSMWGIVAVGMTYVIILGGIDLSVGSMVALLGGSAIYAMNAVAESGHSATLAVWTAVGVCLVGGVILGLINGLTISWGRIAPFITTLGSMAIFRSLILGPAEGSEVRAAVSSFSNFGSGLLEIPFVHINKTAEDTAGTTLMLPYPVLAFLGVVVVGQLVLSFTSFGLKVYSIGDNPKAARYAGVHIGLVTTAVYAICGLTAGIAAFLTSSRLNSIASSSTGLFYELDAIAAVVIGGTRLQGGAGQVWTTAIGVLIIGVATNMLNMLDVHAYYQGMVKGLIVIGAVLLQVRKPTE